MLLGPHRTAPPLCLLPPPMAPTLPPSFSPTTPPSHQSRKSGATLWPEPSSTDLPTPPLSRAPSPGTPFAPPPPLAPTYPPPLGQLSLASSLGYYLSLRLCSFPRLRGRTLCSQLLGKGSLPLHAHTPRRQGVVASAR